MVKRLRDGAINIRPARSGEALLVEWQDGSGLRCLVCRGRAFIEYDELADAPETGHAGRLRSAGSDQALVA